MRKSTFEEEIARNGFLLYRNVGDSMLPLIRQGKDLLLIARKPEGRLRKYDVPLYRRDSGQYVLHRILKVRENDYVICGDNRWRCETGITDRHEVLLYFLHQRCHAPRIPLYYYECKVHEEESSM